MTTMTDEELVGALRAIDHGSIEDCFLQSPYFSKAADRIETLTAQLDAAAALIRDAVSKARAVKPLVWEEQKISDQWSRLYATSILGGYEALQWSDGTFGGSVPSGMIDEPNVEFTAASLEAAKAAAQADYTARILSALEDKP